MTANTANIRDLWQNKTYSDFIIRADGEEDLHCNQCIVYPRSKMIKDKVSLEGYAGAISDQDEAGRIVIDIHKDHYAGMKIMVRAMYENDAFQVICNESVEDMVKAIELALQDGQDEFAEAVYRALLPMADNYMLADEIMELIPIMRGMQNETILAMADKLEMAWMPKFLVDKECLPRLDTEDVEKFLDSMKLCGEEATPERGFEMKVTKDATPPPSRTAMVKKAPYERKHSKRASQVPSQKKGLE
ncbi:unnamed protein product [Zymoseptoria tritici ST99CH_3D1]|nr:unnamed protein product [Zymoseptoria tritici ST99CH_3D1]